MSSQGESIMAKLKHPVVFTNVGAGQKICPGPGLWPVKLPKSSGNQGALHG